MEGNTILAILLSLILGLGVGISSASVYNMANPQVVIKEVPKVVELPGVVITKEVIKEVPVEILKEVKVDNQYLAKVMSFAQDNIDEDLTLDYVLFEDAAREQSLEYINANLAEILDDEDYFDSGKVLEDFRKSEVSIRSIQDAVIESNNYEDLDLELVYEVKVKAKEGSDSSVYNSFNITMVFENGRMVEEDTSAVLI
jgi:hypothetical protein